VSATPETLESNDIMAALADALATVGVRRSRFPARLRSGVTGTTLIGVDALGIPSVLAIVEAEQERTARQIASLEGVVAAIVEGSELTSTDDEHDPEGATITYERAQATALLRQARSDSDALLVTRRQLLESRRVVCADCGRGINLERIAALPTAKRCVECAA
jgi:DnaK suppressor protein